MTFTKEELETIRSMCRHERTLLDTIETVVQGLRISHAHALVAGIASKAQMMAEAMDKSEKEEAKKETA